MRSTLLSCWSWCGLSAQEMGGNWRPDKILRSIWSSHWNSLGQGSVCRMTLLCRLSWIERTWRVEPVHKNISLIHNHCAICFEFSSVRQVAKLRGVISLVFSRSSRSSALTFEPFGDNFVWPSLNPPCLNLIWPILTTSLGATDNLKNLVPHPIMRSSCREIKYSDLIFSKGHPLSPILYSCQDFAQKTIGTLFLRLRDETDPRE